MNKGKLGRRITTSTQENIEAVQQALEIIHWRVTVRRNGLGTLPSLFCRIIKKNLRWYSHKKIRHHNLKDGDYERRSVFFSGFCISAAMEGS